jgi:hypothetical protein
MHAMGGNLTAIMANPASMPGAHQLLPSSKTVPARGATERSDAQTMRRFMFAFLASLFSSAADAEAISYSIYSLPLLLGEPKLMAEGKRIYSQNDIHTLKGPASNLVNWEKTLSIANGFEIGASVYREPRTDGFGLWIRKDGGGFSWEWFVRETDHVFRKLQGPGRVKVRFARFDQLQELAEVEFLDDVTMRLNTFWFIPFLDKKTDHLVVRKGSVLWLAP